jgi:uncharacterized membrane protein
VTFNVPLDVLAGEQELFELTILSEVLIASEGGAVITYRPAADIPITMAVGEMISLRWGNIQDQNMLPGSSIDYELTLYNQGNSDVGVTVIDHSPSGWQFNVENGNILQIDAFGAVTFNATLFAPPDVLAGTDVDVDLSAVIGTDYFDTTLKVTIEQLYRVSVDGYSSKFADPGETAQFNLTVTNMGNGNDRVDISVSTNGGQWAISVDENFVDLGTSEVLRSHDLHVLMTAPQDAKAFEEHTFTIYFTSEDGETVTTHDVTLTANPKSSFTVDTDIVASLIVMDDPLRNKATYLVIVDNDGNLEDLFHIGIQGLPDGWTTEFDSRMVSVTPRTYEEVEFSIIPPGDGSPVPATAGTYSFRVNVASELGNGDPVVKELSATIQTHRGHSVSSLEPTYTAPSGSSLTFRVLLVNEGNVLETLTLNAAGGYERIKFELAEVELAPFGQRVVNITVVMPSTTDDRTLNLQVIANTKDQSAQEYVIVPIDIKGRSGAPGPGALAALAALAFVAVASLAVADRRRRD